MRAHVLLLLIVFDAAIAVSFVTLKPKQPKNLGKKVAKDYVTQAKRKNPFKEPVKRKAPEPTGSKAMPKVPKTPKNTKPTPKKETLSKEEQDAAWTMEAATKMQEAVVAAMANGMDIDKQKMTPEEFKKYMASFKEPPAALLKKFHTFLDVYPDAQNGKAYELAKLTRVIDGQDLAFIKPDKGQRKYTRDLNKWMHESLRDGPFVQRQKMWEYRSEYTPEAVVHFKEITKNLKGTEQVRHILTTFLAPSPNDLVITDYPTFEFGSKRTDMSMLPDNIAKYFDVFTTNTKHEKFPKCFDMQSLLGNVFDYKIPGMPHMKNPQLFTNICCRAYLSQFSMYEVTPIRHFTYADDGDTAVMYKLAAELRESKKMIAPLTSVTTFPKMIKQKGGPMLIAAIRAFTDYKWV